MKDTLPTAFQAYPWRKTASIIDCFEVFIERPSSPLASALPWSNYKHSNTVKYLISITPHGFISFIPHYKFWKLVHCKNRRFTFFWLHWHVFHICGQRTVWFERDLSMIYCKKYVGIQGYLLVAVKFTAIDSAFVMEEKPRKMGILKAMVFLQTYFVLYFTCYPIEFICV